jgi:hypothetical protein
VSDKTKAVILTVLKEMGSSVHRTALVNDLPPIVAPPIELESRVF